MSRSYIPKKYKDGGVITPKDYRKIRAVEKIREYFSGIKMINMDIK